MPGARKYALQFAVFSKVCGRVATAYVTAATQ
jgi:hypothetical protein